MCVVSHHPKQICHSQTHAAYHHHLHLQSVYVVHCKLYSLLAAVLQLTYAVCYQLLVICRVLPDAA
jgi:hypothetical protein